LANGLIEFGYGNVAIPKPRALQERNPANNGLSQAWPEEDSTSVVKEVT
jgi:hypothetical protein